jgi:hypothetical protein
MRCEEYGGFRVEAEAAGPAGKTVIAKIFALEPGGALLRVFMGDLWAALVADKLGPGGHETAWTETAVRIRNQSGAGFQASAAEKIPVYGLSTPGAGGAKKTASRSGRNPAGKSRDQRERQLALMSSVPEPA